MVLAAPSTNDAEMGERKLSSSVCSLADEKRTGRHNNKVGKRVKAKPKHPSLNKWTKMKMKTCHSYHGVDAVYSTKVKKTTCLLDDPLHPLLEGRGEHLRRPRLLVKPHLDELPLLSDN